MKFTNAQKGFTLLEIMVAVALFAMVATLSASSLIIISAAQKRVFLVQTNQDNVRFALELMAREIRQGNHYVLDTLSQRFEFQTFEGDAIRYGFVTGSTLCTNDPGITADCILKSIKPAGASAWGAEQPVTAPEVSIKNLKFVLTGEGVGDQYQPRVTIIMDAATPGPNPQQAELHIQTTISQQKEDLVAE